MPQLCKKHEFRLAYAQRPWHDGKETGIRFAFRFGVTGLTTPAGAVQLNPPHSQKLPRLTAGSYGRSRR